MRRDKHLATEMRRDGKSYNEIVAALKIPKATLSDWFSKVDWSDDIRKRLSEAAQVVHTVRIRELDRVRGLHLRRAYEEAREEAREEFEILKYNPLFIAGLMIYWGEGDKRTDHSTRLINTDGEMIKLFVFFLRKACRIPDYKIKAVVTIYPDLDREICVDYWSKIADINRRSFTKCITIAGRHKERRVTYGMCSVVVSSTYFKAKVREWLKLMPQELMMQSYYETIDAKAGIV